MHRDSYQIRTGRFARRSQDALRVQLFAYDNSSAIDRPALEPIIRRTWGRYEVVVGERG